MPAVRYAPFRPTVCSMFARGHGSGLVTLASRDVPRHRITIAYGQRRSLNR